MPPAWVQGLCGDWLALHQTVIDNCLYMFGTLLAAISELRSMLSYEVVVTHGLHSGFSLKMKEENGMPKPIQTRYGSYKSDYTKPHLCTFLTLK